MWKVIIFLPKKLKILVADETPILKLIGTSSVKGIEHSSLTDSLAAPKKNAQLEISDFDDQIKSSVQKTSNAVQIFTSNVSVSRSMQAVATYGGKELERETAKRAKEHKLDMEYALFGLGRDADVKKSVFKAPSVRTDATAGEMAGLFYFLAKGAESYTAKDAKREIYNIIVVKLNEDIFKITAKKLEIKRIL